MGDAHMARRRVPAAPGPTAKAAASGRAAHMAEVAAPSHVVRLARAVAVAFAILCALALAALGGLAVGGYVEARQAVAERPVEATLQTIEASPSYVAFDELPQTYVWAVVATEDHRFFYHAGVDPIAIARALAHDLRTRSFAQGGSTIPQQLAKNLWFTQEKTLPRKAAEVWVAFDLERARSKRDLLALYASTIYFGDGCYGLRDAARHYYGVEPRELTDEQCTMLAGLPNAPSVLSADPAAAARRQAYVEERMRLYGYGLAG